MKSRGATLRDVFVPHDPRIVEATAGDACVGEPRREMPIDVALDGNAMEPERDFRRANWSERTGMLAGRCRVARLKPRATTSTPH